MPVVEVYSKDWCPYCTRAKSLLQRKGVSFQEIDVTTDRRLEREMIRRAGGRRTVPQIFIDGVHVGGSDDLHALDAAGKLDPMLQTAPAQRKDTREHDVVILGSGPAGLTAAIYAARANLRPAVVEGLGAGGQLVNTTEVENYPGFPEGIMGPDLMQAFRAQAERFGATFVAGDAMKIDLGARPFGIWTEEGELRAHALIIATGASPRYLNIPGEKEYAGRGVSYCATCDGFFFRQQEIMVVGGGDTAMEEALFLSRYGSRVTIVHRRDAFRASRIMADRVLRHDKIEVVWNTVVDEVLGDGQRVQSVRLRDVVTGEQRERPVSGFFVAIGYIPNTSLFQGLLPMDEQGYLKVERGSFTPIPGVFAAGDVHDHVYRQAVTAAGAGCRAAIDCERWLETRGK